MEEVIHSVTMMQFCTHLKTFLFRSADNLSHATISVCSFTSDVIINNNNNNNIYVFMYYYAI